MVAEFEPLIRLHGAWQYPRLHWECGVIGQQLYLEAQALGHQGTGIGCFFDDLTNRLLNVEDLEYQSLYHFAIGCGVNDTRLTMLPGYPSS